MVTAYGYVGTYATLPSIPICPQEPWEAQEEAHRDRSRVNFSFPVRWRTWSSAPHSPDRVSKENEKVLSMIVFLPAAPSRALAFRALPTNRAHLILLFWYILVSCAIKT